MFTLTETELEKYYANIYAVAHADGTLAGAESALLESVRKEMKIKKTVANSAEKSVESGIFQLTPVGTWANQVDNLERMLTVALADGELSDAETQLVATFAKGIGIEQSQMDMLVSGVKSRLNPIVAGSDEALDFTPPPTGIGIEFAESTRPDFPDVLALASHAPVFQECRRVRKKWYLAAWPDGMSANTLALASALNWQTGRPVFLNGQRFAWRDVFGFLECAEKRAKAFAPEKYCFGMDGSKYDLNPWGCLRLYMGWSDWNRDPDWLTFGHWEEIRGGLLWHFDKPRILHLLKTKREEVGCCPYLSPTLQEAFVAALPDVVSPVGDPNWTYKECDSNTPGAVKVTIRENEDDYLYSHEACIFGVSPKSSDLMFSILSKIR